MQSAKKNRCRKGNGLSSRCACVSAGTGTAGTGHPGEDKTLAIDIVYGGIGQHIVGSGFEEEPEPIPFESRISTERCFGYVHSQRGASPTRHNEQPYPPLGDSVPLYDFLELLHSHVG